MNGFRISNAALNDLREIAAYTEKRWGRQQRREYLSLIDSVFTQLAENPSSGTDCDYISGNLRKYPCASHVLYYEADGAGVFIIRILHRRMDVGSALSQ